MAARLISRTISGLRRKKLHADFDIRLFTAKKVQKAHRLLRGRKIERDNYVFCHFLHPRVQRTHPSVYPAV
jgi:hypothetical protein